MRAIIQRVRNARCLVDNQVVGEIDQGWLVLLAVGQGDRREDADYLVDRICGLRAFGDDRGRMNRSLADVDGSLLVISQFTLYADLSSRRPGFTDAADPQLARELYDYACDQFAARHRTARGIFAADMQIELCNDGPVTFAVESPSAANGKIASPYAARRRADNQTDS